MFIYRSTDRSLCVLDRCKPGQEYSLHPDQKYSLFGQYINLCDVLSDLGIMRSANCEYQQHRNAVITRGRRVTEAILLAFTTRNPKILWPAFI